ncbi:MAG: hypothetical protein ACI9JN_001331, partial [Bacteroidia bacterium]
MNEETNKNSELEAFFQKRLNSDVTDGEGWDTPPANVIDNAFNALDEKKRKKFGFWWLWVTGGVSLIIIISVLMWNTNRISTLDGKLSAFIESQENKQNSNLKPNEKSDNDIQGGHHKFSSPFNIYQPHTRRQTKQQTRQQTPLPQFGGSDIALLSKSDSMIDPITEIKNAVKNNLETAKVETLVKVDKEEVKKGADQLDSTSIVLTSDGEEKDTVSKTTDTDPMNKNSVYVLFGANTSSLSMSAVNPLPDNLTRYDNWYPGYQVGVGMSRNLKSSALSIDFNLVYQAFRNNSVFKNESVYTKSNEGINSAGQPMYNATVGLESPIGHYADRLAINLNNQSFTEGDKLKNTTNISNKFHVVAAQMGLNYRLYQRSNWELKARIGVGVNYVLEMKQSMDFEMKYQSTVLTTSTFEEVSKTHMSNAFGSASVGFKLNRNFKNRMFWGLS